MLVTGYEQYPSVFSITYMLPKITLGTLNYIVMLSGTSLKYKSVQVVTLISKNI